MSDQNSKLATDDAKNGLVTANGVILAFVLGFFVNYTSADQAWRGIDFIPIGTLCASLALLSYSLYRTFIPYTQTIAHFENTVRLMMLGIALSILGSVFGIIL